MMGAAMLKRHRFVQSLWALYRLVVSSITFAHLVRGGRRSPCYVVKVKTCRQLKDADGIFQLGKRCRQQVCLGKRCQRQPSAYHK